MSFKLPEFNLTCNIWTGPTSVGHTKRLSSPCNLALGRRVDQVGPILSFSQSYLHMSLLLPALTDIRFVLNATGPDIVEVPAGSGRFYQVASVDDAGKGFTNEHRVAFIVGVTEGGPWPTPIP